MQYDLTVMLCQSKNYQEELLKELLWRVSLYYTMSQDRKKIAVKSNLKRLHRRVKKERDCLQSVSQRITGRRTGTRRLGPIPFRL